MIKLNLIARVAFSLAICFSNAQAQSLPKLIETKLEHYANSAGCDFSMDERNIVHFDINGDNQEEYVALFEYDDDCSGGSGSVKSYLAVFDRNSQGEIYIRPEMTEPVIPGFGLPDYINRIFIKDGKLWYSGFIHSKTDANNFPSIPIQSELSLITHEVAVPTGHKITVHYWMSSHDHQSQ